MLLVRLTQTDETASDNLLNTLKMVLNIAVKDVAPCSEK